MLHPPPCLELETISLEPLVCAACVRGFAMLNRTHHIMPKRKIFLRLDRKFSKKHPNRFF